MSAPGTGAEGGPRPANFRQLPYVWSAVSLNLIGGLGLIAWALLGLVGGWLGGTAWQAAVQAHGYLQLVGWAGLMVLGVGQHILPRLRGVRPPESRWAPVALPLIVVGLVLRLVGQPLAALVGPSWSLLGLALSGQLIVVGVGLVVAPLVAAHLVGPAPGAGFRQVAPLLALAFVSLLLALVFAAGFGLQAALAGSVLVDPVAEAAVVTLLLQGFLLSMSLAVSARFLPLYLGTRPEGTGWHRLTAGLVAGALLLALAAAWWTGLRPLTDTALAAALLAGLRLVGQYRPTEQGIVPAIGRAELLPTGLFRPQPPPPGRRRAVDPATQAARLAVRSAYAWLVVAALLSLARAGEAVGWAPPPADLVRHALGAGYVTLLIDGMATLILPGLLRGRPPAVPAIVMLVSANLAALLRLLPGLAAWAGLPLPSQPMVWLAAAVAGVCASVGLLLVMRGIVETARRQQSTDNGYR